MDARKPERLGRPVSDKCIFKPGARDRSEILERASHAVGHQFAGDPALQLWVRDMDGNVSMRGHHQHEVVLNILQQIRRPTGLDRALVGEASQVRSGGGYRGWKCGATAGNFVFDETLDDRFGSR